MLPPGQYPSVTTTASLLAPPVPFPTPPRPASVSQWNAHSRAVVFHTLHRGHRDTRLCPLISYSDRYLYLLHFFCPKSPPLLPLLHSSPSSPSTAAAGDSRAPSRSISFCYHHRIPTRAPGALSDPSHRSNRDCVEIYCATVFCRRLMYSSIAKNPASYSGILHYMASYFDKDINILTSTL